MTLEHEISSSIHEPGAGLVKTVARLIFQRQTDTFGQVVLDFVGELVPFDCGLVVYYRRRRKPDLLADRLVNPGRRNTSAQYLEQAYKVDPVYQWARSLAEPEIVRTLDIVVEEFDQSDYFRAYYRLSGVIDEVNLLIPTEEGRCFAVSIERAAESPPFADEELRRLRIWLPVVVAAFKVQTPKMEVSPNLEEASDVLDLGVVLKRFGANILTQREREVAQMILAGHSAPSIGLNLEISTETVRVHRRNIYNKLGVTSIAELFALVLRSIDEVMRGGEDQAG